MMLYALKEDMDPEGPEATREINEMKRAVKGHRLTPEASLGGM